jgi:hypothetical protein
METTPVEPSEPGGRKVTMETRDQLASKTKGKIATSIEPYSGFYLAEGLRDSLKEEIESFGLAKREKETLTLLSEAARHRFHVRCDKKFNYCKSGKGNYAVYSRPDRLSKAGRGRVLRPVTLITQPLKHRTFWLLLMWESRHS